MVVTGDPTQVDLPEGMRSGLTEALETLRGSKGSPSCGLTDRDVVRHELVARIVRAYEARERAKAARWPVSAPMAEIDVAVPCAAWRRVCPDAEALARAAARAALAQSPPGSAAGRSKSR